MTHLFSGRWKISLFVLLSLFASTACLTLTPGSPAGTATSPGSTHTSPASTQISPETTPTPPGVSLTPNAATAQAAVVFGPGPLILTDTIAGLADLASYTATLKYSFDGTRDGKAEQWSKTYVMLTTKEPAARQLTIETAGNISDTSVVLMAEVDGAAYERRGANDCTASVIRAGKSLADWLEPAGILSSVIGADKAGSETVNGVAADHYTFDERALGGVGIAKSTGELWVATQGGYLVKYVLTTKGDANAFGKGIAGTLTWDYELTGANEPVAIQLPADCPAGMVNAPLLPDAANVQKLPGLLTYDTATSLADAAAFYQKQIPDLGWTQLDDPLITDTSVLLDYTQGDKSLTVIITAGDAGTKVDIELGSAKQ